MNLRTGVRYDKKTSVAVELSAPNGSPMTGGLRDLSKAGCAVEADGSQISIGDNITLTIGECNRPLKGVVRHVTQLEEERHVIGVELLSGIRPEGMGSYIELLAHPARSSDTRAQLNQQQDKIAPVDLEARAIATEGLTQRKFMLIATSTPLLFSMLAAGAVPIVSSIASGQAPHLWAVCIPLTGAMLSYLVLLMFNYEVSAGNRDRAFIMILQDALAMGEFPTNYRGYDDAVANLALLSRYGSDDPKYRVHWPLKNVGKLSISGGIYDAPNLIACCLLLLVPIVATALMWMAFAQADAPRGLHTMVVSMTTGIVLICTFCSIRSSRELFVGRKSFWYYKLALSKVLKHSPPFNPANYSSNGGPRMID